MQKEFKILWIKKMDNKMMIKEIKCFKKWLKISIQNSAKKLTKKQLPDSIN